MAELAASVAVYGLVSGLLAALWDRGRQGSRRRAAHKRAAAMSQAEAFKRCGAVAMGLLAMLVSTRAGTLDTVPLTLVAGAALGGPPFALAWWLGHRGMKAVNGPADPPP